MKVYGRVKVYFHMLRVLTSAVDGVSNQRHTSATLPQGKQTLKYKRMQAGWISVAQEEMK